MSDNSNIQNSLFEAMKIFSESATANSGATITIDGKITAIQDEAAGIYSIEYLGSTFTVHSNSTAAYSVGDSVYILVPDGDFTKEKIILGLISASASVYTSEIENGENYYEVSDNLVDNDIGTIKMSSYDTIQPDEKQITITTHDASTFGALINGYLNDYRTFKLGVLAKTTLAVEQQSKGNYGICLNIPILIHEAKINDEGISEGIVETASWKKVYLDVGNFIGTPYRYTAWAPQETYFTIDEQYIYDTTRTPYYSYYCYDFTQDANKTKVYDIQLKEVSLEVVNAMTQDETTGYSLSLKASEGEYYSTFYSNVKTLTPTLKINGKTTSLKKAAIYWFIEDTGVKGDSEYYSTYGGYGWKCLNTRTNTTYNEDGTKTFDYITTVQTHDVNRSDVRAATRFKCAIVYSGKTLSAIITLKNLAVKESLTLTSSKNLSTENGVTTIAANQDNTYMKDTGYVSLSALVYYDGVTNVDDNRTKVLYDWARYDKDGNYINDDSTFFTLVANNKITKIDGKSYFVTQVKFPVNKVEELNTVYCTAKYIYIDTSSNRYEEQIGTAKLGIATSTEYNLNLNINGDNIIYKYDVDGDSPMGNAYDGPTTSKVTEITPLTFTITRADGSELSADEYQFVKYSWQVPKSTISLFTLNSSSGEYREEDNYYYYEGYGNSFNLYYKIASRFNISKSKQPINLTVTFQGTSISKSASISFMKEGMSGSNGTAYSAILISGGTSADDDASVGYGILDANGVAQKLKFVYNSSSKKLYRHDYTTNTLVEWSSSQKRIYPQVWRDSTVLTYNTGSNDGHYAVEYSMFDDGITTPCFMANKQTEGSCLLSLSSTPTSDSCNIVQAKITINDGNSSTANATQVIYAYYPIELTITNFNPSFIPSMDGGFGEVMYASDGTNPSYDETENFTINDDSIVKDDAGSVADYFNVTWEAQNHLGIYNVNESGVQTGKKQTKVTGTAYTVKIKPDNKYDDGNSKNFVRTTLAFNTSKESSLNTERATCVTAKNNANNSITAENNNLTYITNTVNTYNSKVKSWYTALSDIKELLVNETNALYELTKLKTDLILETQNYISMQEKYNEQAELIATTVADYTAALIILNTQVATAITQLEEMDGTTGAAAKDLISLEDYKYELTATEEAAWKDAIGLEITNALKISMDRINESIDYYQESYTKLQATLYQTQLNTYNQIKTDLQTIADKIPSSAFARYLEFKKLILKIRDEFNEGVSYDYLYSKLQAIENLFYSIAVINSDHTLTLRDSITAEKKENVDTYSAIVTTNTNRINVIDAILATKNHSIVHIRPIVLYFNRYEMSNINAWDGNKLETGDGSYLLAPQVGAGTKNDTTGTFTGIMMGLRSTSSSVASTNTKQTGLFGYSDGKQSLYLSAETGASIFGIAGSGGQIIIDPSSRNGSSGAIYSSNYFTSDGYDKTTGLPKSITSNLSGKGMIINFSEPSIKYGSGYFTVDSNGNLHAGGGGDGDVGGWNIYNTTLQSANYKASKNGICLDAGNDAIIFGSSKGKIYSGSHSTLTNTSEGFYLSYDGLSIGSKAKIVNDGTMYLGTGAVAGTGKHWTINGDGTNSYIAYGTRGNSNSVYLATDELTIGSKFYVNASDGSMRLGNGAVANNSKHWTINTNGDNSYIAYGTTSFSDTSGVYMGTDGIRLGSNFKVDNSGSLESKDGKIGGWTITSSTLAAGNLTLNSNGSITKTGASYNWSIGTDGTATFNKLIASNSGTIGGWNIGTSQLSSATGNTTLNSNGTITCDKLYASTSGTIGGWTINSSSLSSTGGGGLTLGTSGISGLNFSLNSSGLTFTSSGTSLNGSKTTLTDGSTYVGSKGLSTYVKDLAVDSLNVASELTFQGVSVKWQSVRVITKRKMEWTNATCAYVTNVTLDGSITKGYDINVSKDDSRKYCTDLESTSWYRDIYLLTNKGDRHEGGGED